MGTWRMSPTCWRGAGSCVSPLARDGGRAHRPRAPERPWRRRFRRPPGGVRGDAGRHPVRRDRRRRLAATAGDSRDGWPTCSACRPTARGAASPTSSTTCGRWETGRSARSCTRSGRRPLARILAGRACGRKRSSCSVGVDGDRRDRLGHAASACSQADIVSRTATLATHGWAAVLPTSAGPRVARRRAAADQPLRPARRACSTTTPTSSSSRRTATRPGSAWNQPTRYAIILPRHRRARGGRPGRPTTGSSGSSAAARARLLRALDEPVEHERSPARVCRWARSATTSR